MRNYAGIIASETFPVLLPPLRKALEREVEALNQLEHEGVIQRLNIPLCWPGTCSKTGWSTTIALPTVTPLRVMRQAFQARLIQDGDTWVDMLTDRKSHVAYLRFCQIRGGYQKNPTPIPGDSR